MKTQNPAETLQQCCRARPFLKPFTDAFEPLITGRREEAERLAPMLAEAGIALSSLPYDRPLLKEGVPPGLGRFIKEAAGALLPKMLSLKAMAPFKAELESLFLENDAADLEALAAACLADAPDALITMAEKRGLAPQILEFAASFIVSAALRALAAPLKGEEFEGWRKGVCPVCGSPPVIAWLGRRPPAQENEFLRDGGGRKRLHCGMCGSDWHFVRGVCPGCGAEGQEAMHIFGEESRMHERADWCEKCRSYLPQIDLRELIDTPDMDAMALGLMHLDLAAAQKDLSPLKASFWNMF